jgi:hypothetical protein
VVLTGCFACTQPTEAVLSNSDRDEIIGEVTLMLHTYYDDIRKEGFMSELKYLEDNEDFYWIPPGFETAISYDSVVTIITKNAPAYQHVDNQWEDLTVKALSPGMALYSGRLKSFMTDTAGRISNTRMIETGIVSKKSGQWKLLHGQTSLLR